ncbi:ComEC/Rec2 family competence protein [Rhodovulum sp. 12E13]|uniref:ComEC/Rec2 family competence protein n=1 Tax=Rhodovulum sp. 12E13 TaxID=2203891 RepID=UPI001F3CA2AF|nr:ComEC/Rec2 family competence protein [Rhodovulum sp. 12E13]
MYADPLDETRAAGPPARPSLAARIAEGAAGAVRAQRGHLVHWVPVCLAAGIGGWFSLKWEPGVAHYAALALVTVLLVLAARWAGELAAPFLVGLALVCAGGLAAGARAHLVAAPVLEFRYYGPVEGRIVGIDRSASGALRLTLDRVRLDRVAPRRTPERVRLSLHGAQGWAEPVPGLTVMATAHLSPPGGPVEPGGFDFARMAWFDRLGAVGYTRAPVLMAAPAEEGAALAVFRIRMALSTAIQEALPGPRGAFATAILTGDRSGIPEDALEDLRGANLAHLLAISGLHMGLLTGVVFGVIRGGIALVPWAALRLPGKKIAALAALAAGAVYLALSGGNVATVRAYVMVSVVLVAVLLDRRAISLRSVAIAATLVLLMTPEALSGPGFQMSFAATTALVAAFGAVRDWRAGVPAWALPVGTVVLSSAVAGAATAPFAAAHFNRFTDYGLVANLLSVPLMGAVIMPAAVAAAVLAPFGLGHLGLAVMGWGLAWVLGVADWITSLEGAITPVVAPGPGVLPLLSLGALVVVLWRGHGRWAGLVPLALALALWAGTERPALLIAPSGGLIGLMGPEGRVLSKSRGDGFSAEVWLENDGDMASQDEAADRPGLPGTVQERRLDVAGLRVAHVTGRDRAARAGAACAWADLLIVNTALEAPQEGGCLLLDAAALRETGAVAIHDDARGARLVTAAERAGARLWAPR